ncbi:MAG: 5'-nucleotidase [Acidimicrobiales bacterium]
MLTSLAALGDDDVCAGHANDELVREIDGKGVSMTDNRGRLLTDTDVTVNTVILDMIIVAINNVPTLRQGVTPVAEVTRLIDKYEALSSGLSNSIIGRTTTSISRTGNDAGESALGDIIADAPLVATPPNNGGAPTLCS